MEKIKTPLDMDYEESEEEVNEPELVLDTGNTLVRAIDGAVISNDDELIRMLFYYYKPGENPKGDKIECKTVIELRISQSKFLEMTKEFDEKVTELQRYHKKKSDYMFG